MGGKNVPKIQRENIGISMTCKEEKRSFSQHSKLCDRNSKADDEEDISINILEKYFTELKKGPSQN